jgi:hypothetical protein
MAKGIAANIPAIAGAPNTSEPAQPLSEVAEAERRRDHTHEHQQFGNRQHTDHQFEGRREFHAEDVQAHEDDVRADRRVFRVEGGNCTLR